MIGDRVESGVVWALLIAALFLIVLFAQRNVRRVLVRGRRSRQVAAVPIRRGTDGRVEVLVVSTRGSGRWTVPKGWPMRGRSDADAAAQEAYEEAGVRGRIAPEPLGTFEYVKRRNDSQLLLVTVYRLDVERHVHRFRERGERDARWLSAPAAAERVAWPGLADIIRHLESPPETEAR